VALHAWLPILSGVIVLRCLAACIGSGEGGEVSAMTAVGSALLFFGFLFVACAWRAARHCAWRDGRRGDTHRRPGHHVGANNVYAGISKYPLIAIPVFVLAGMIFERVGVAQSIVRFASAIVGQRRGSLAITAVLVA